MLHRDEQGFLGMSVETEEDVECLVKDTERQELHDETEDEVGLKHPITFDVYDLDVNIITRTDYQLLTFKCLKTFSRILKYRSSPKKRRVF